MEEQWTQTALEQWKDNGKILAVQPVSGGDINEAFYVCTANRQYFVKRNQQVVPDFFQVEVEGLERISNTETMDVPNVYGISVDAGIPSLWLEWVEGQKNEQTDHWFGERLAQLHQVNGEGYGYPTATYIGKLKQPNRWKNDWITYYRDYRIGKQFELGRKIGTIQGERAKKLSNLMDTLEQWIPKHPSPSLLHGDLWGGNWMVGKGGEPYLIDPSVVYGDREMELAFTQLFGGFSPSFYDAYQAAYPLSKDYEERKEIYQLFYLLVHLNMFGEGYGRPVDRILEKYMK